jgi:hypothetical protein
MKIYMLPAVRSYNAFSFVSQRYCVSFTSRAMSTQDRFRYAGSSMTPFGTHATARHWQPLTGMSRLIGAGGWLAAGAR